MDGKIKVEVTQSDGPPDRSTCVAVGLPDGQEVLVYINEDVLFASDDPEKAVHVVLYGAPNLEIV